MSLQTDPDRPESDGAAPTPAPQDSTHTRRVTFTLPDRFKDASRSQIDVTAPKTRRGRYMNQSFISMVATVGSSVSFGRIDPTYGHLAVPAADEGEDAEIETTQISHGRRTPRSTFDDQRMLMSMPTLKKPQRNARRRLSQTDNMTTSQILQPVHTGSESAEADTAESTEENDQSTDEEGEFRPESSEFDSDHGTAKESLPETLARMFSLKIEEQVLAEFQCHLLQHVMLPGTLFILDRHICFYAYLDNQMPIVKSGFLSKRGKSNPQYHRYWFSLRGETLSYYEDAAQPYFPRNAFDLRLALSVQQEIGDEDEARFKLILRDGEVYFRAESVSSAKEWVTKLRKILIRQQNESGTVKVCIPVDNILEIEESLVFEPTATIRIRAIDNDDTYALDDYFFSFHGQSSEAVEEIRKAFARRQITRSPDTAILEAAYQNIPSLQLPERLVSKYWNWKRAPKNASEPSSRPPSRSRPSSSDDKRPILQQSMSSARLQDLVRAGAGLLKARSQRVGSLLANESRGYYERVTGMWAGKITHYSEGDTDIRIVDKDDEVSGEAFVTRFRSHFALGPTEKLQATYFTYFQRLFPVYGKLYVGSTKLCFRSLLPGTRTKMVLPFQDMENVLQETGFRFGYSGLVVVVKGYEELFFEFSNSEARDDCALTLLHSLESARLMSVSRILNTDQKTAVVAAKLEHEQLRAARRSSLVSLSDGESKDVSTSGILFDDPQASMLNFKPSEGYRITCLTIGSRGDVQPYIALCKGLLKEGHKPKIATHSEYGPWVESHGIEFAPIAGDAGEIMALCVENDPFTVQWMRVAKRKFSAWLDELLISAWEASQNSDLIIESPSGMAGVHIAEALQVPYFRAFTMPWTRTRAYSHAFAFPKQRWGGNYNMLSYVMIDNVFWLGIAGQINKWRTSILSLPKTTLDKLKIEEYPFLYCVSPAVFTKPLDFSPWIHITGYWFLDEGVDYSPPPELTDFIARARKDGKKIFYAGFGSITLENPAALTAAIIDAVKRTDACCILIKGWSDRLNADPTTGEVPLPDTIFKLRSAPHDWLFGQIDAAVHHGGSGTTGASLRAGLPTIVKPFFGDQYFFASRVADLGVGIRLDNINGGTLAAALYQTLYDTRMIEKARRIGEKIRAENGVENAIQAIYRELEYAKSLIKPHPRMGKRGGSLEENEEDIEAWEIVGGYDGGSRAMPEFKSTLDSRPDLAEAALESSDEDGNGFKTRHD